MPDSLDRLRRFLRELKRRDVYKVAATYAVVGFVLIQVADLTFVRLGLPSWTVTFVIVLVAVGFPLAIVVAWAFERTPEGVRRTPETESVEEGTTEAGQVLSTGYKVLVGLGLVAAAVAGGWYLTGGDSEPEVTDRSIAVLPFENMGGDVSDQFTRGVHDGLLTRLANISELEVISRTSVMQYEGTDKTVPEIGGELGAGWVVEGAVQQVGGQVQVNAQLIKAPEDAHQWAESYLRELNPENLFAIQGELTKKIAQSLEAQLSPEEKERVERQPTEDLGAYRIYVQGRTYLDQRTEVGMRRSVDYFRRAIAKDSSYALAWVGLADALTLLGGYGHAAADSVLPLAERAAERALQLDPSSGEAHTSISLIHSEHGRGPAALRELRRALELKPSYAEAHNFLSWTYYLLGRPKKGLESARRAMELDPLSPEAVSNVAEGYLFVGNPKEALAAARRAQELQPDFRWVQLIVATTLYRLAQLDEARQSLRGLEVATAKSAPRVLGALIDVASGDSAMARSTLQRLRKEAGSPFYPGLVYAALGKRDSAFVAFQRLEGWGRSPHLAWPNLTLRYQFPTVLDPLRDDARYEKLIRDINRAWGLNPDGSLPDSVDVSLESDSDI